VELDRPQMKICCMHIACWNPKATNTHSEYVILITFPLQQRLHECASLLHYTYLTCLVMLFFIADSSNVSSVALKFPFFGLKNARQVEFAHLFDNIPFIFSTFIRLVMQSCISSMPCCGCWFLLHVSLPLT
jgi:hypothetical protein